MRLEMLISSRMRAASHGRAVRLWLCLAVTLGCAFAAAHAQTKTAQNANANRRSSSSASSDSANARTRARRVSKQVTSASASSANTSSNVVKTDSTTAAVAASSSSSTQSASDVETTFVRTTPVQPTATERINLLRAQINDATDAAERARLQRALVETLVSLDRKPEALAELRAVAREERFDPVGFYNAGNALVRLGDFDTAVDAYRKAISQRRGNYSRALNNLGVVLLRQGRWDEAQEALARALQQESFRYAEASYNLGRLYAARGEADLAIREWKRALNVQPDHTDAAVALARAYAEDGSPERALAALDNFATRNAILNNSSIDAARREIRAGVSSSSVVISKDVSTTSSTTVSKSASTNSSNSRSTTNAVTTTSAARSLAPSQPLRTLALERDAYDLLQRARAARASGRYEDAVVFYRRVLARSGGFFPPANLELGYALINLHRNDEAIEILLALTKRDGARYPIAFYHLGRLYELSGQLSLAEQAYSSAASIYGDANPQFLLDASRVREKSGNVAGALAAIESYVRISEQNGYTPDWSARRLAELRQKLAAAQSTTK